MKNEELEGPQGTTTLKSMFYFSVFFTILTGIVYGVVQGIQIIFGTP